eukprot:1294131-Lingulodinium_polyedra.AAC.1
MHGRSLGLSRTRPPSGRAPAHASAPRVLPGRPGPGYVAAGLAPVAAPFARVCPFGAVLCPRALRSCLAGLVPAV